MIVHESVSAYSDHQDIGYSLTKVVKAKKGSLVSGTNSWRATSSKASTALAGHPDGGGGDDSGVCDRE